MPTARRTLGDRVAYAEHAYDALAGADALAIVTEWLEYRNPDFTRMKQLLAPPVIVDGPNLYEPDKLAPLGFTYATIVPPLGRTASEPGRPASHRFPSP